MMENNPQDFLLYRQVEVELERLANCGQLKKGGRIPGERVLAEKLGVARGTLRIALEALEKRNFLIRIPGKGTFLRDNGLTVRNIKIGFVFPEPEISLVFQQYSHYAISSEIWRGILEGCAFKGVTALFIPARKTDDPAENRKLFDRIKQDCNAVIFPGSEFEKLSELMKQENFPFSRAGSTAPCGVDYDREKAVRLAAKHLLGTGCRSVCLLTSNPLPDKVSWPTKQRIFREEFAAAGFPLDDDCFIDLACEDSQVLENLRQVIPADKPLPDAFFTATPIISFALLHIAAERHWKIPEEIQIMGYANNMSLRRTIPELSHIELPHAAIGRRAVELLTEKLIEKKHLPASTLLEGELIQGGTTRKTDFKSTI